MTIFLLLSIYNEKKKGQKQGFSDFILYVYFICLDACMDGFWFCLDFVLVLLSGWNQNCFYHIYNGTKHNRIIMNKSGQVMKTLKYGSKILKKNEMIPGEMNQWLTSFAAIS